MPPAAVPDPAAVVGELNTARGQHRPFLIACLRALEATRGGAVVAFDAPLPPVPVRRPAQEGARVADAVWTAYLRYVLGDAEAESWLTQTIRALAPTALVVTIDDNPEPWWQAEMIILHALHSYALLAGDGDALAKTLQCADFHLREIQPDHATNEPWAVHAYASHHDGNVTAETLWHAAHIQHGGRPGPVAVLLARDAEAALRAQLERTAGA